MEFQSGSAVRFVLSLRDDPARIFGTANFFQISRGPFRLPSWITRSLPITKARA